MKFYFRPLLLSCAMATVAYGGDPDPAQQLQSLFAKSDKSGDRAFVVETVMRESMGDGRRETLTTSSVYLLPKEDVVIIKTGAMWYRSEGGREMAWSVSDAKSSVQLANPIKDPAQRSSKLMKAGHSVFWFVPTAANAAYLTDNFKVESAIHEDDKLSFTLKIADDPSDRYWANMKQPGNKLTATLVYDVKSALPLEGRVEMSREGYVRSYEVRIKERSAVLPEGVRVVPEGVDERIVKKLKRLEAKKKKAGE
ncbi:MAG: hypothetical protein ACSHX6_01815 [Akkermansiaceae bacterium]